MPGYLPEVAFTERSIGVICMIRKGVQGFFDFPDNLAGTAGLTADDLNHMSSVTPAQREAMVYGALCGWNHPEADPDFYDELGRVKR